MKRKLLLVVVALVVLLVGGNHWNWNLANAIKDIRSLGPLAFFTAYTLCIICGIPGTPFLLVAGGSFSPGTTVVGVGVSLLCAISGARLVFRYLLKDLVDKLLKKYKISLENVPVRDHAKLVLLIRITPGLPFLVQNSILVSTKVPFLMEILISWPVLLGWSMVYAFLGQKLVSGKLGGILAAAGLIIIIIGAQTVLKKRLLPGADKNKMTNQQ